MNTFKAVIDVIFSFMSSLFNLITSHWLTGLILLIWVFTAIISFTLVRSVVKRSM